MIRIARKIEAIVGAVFAFVLCIAALCIVVMRMIKPGSEREQQLNMAITFLLIVPEALFLLRLVDDLEVAQYPFAPWFALRQFQWPIILRPVVALWWLGHFGTAVAAALLIERVFKLNDNESYGYVVRGVGTIAIYLPITFAANQFLLLAAGSLAKSEKMVNLVWRGRVVVDLSIALVAAVVPSMK